MDSKKVKIETFDDEEIVKSTSTTLKSKSIKDQIISKNMKLAIEQVNLYLQLNTQFTFKMFYFYFKRQRRLIQLLKFQSVV